VHGFHPTARSPRGAGATGGVSDSPGGREAWSRVAPIYSSTFARYTSLAIEPLLDEAGVRGGVEVLDLACGPGLAAAAALRRGARACGADFSGAMVKLASAAVPGARFVRADAHQLPCRSECFGAVVCNFGVHTFADHSGALGEVWRVLRAGGTFAFTVWDAAERSEVQRLLELAVRTRGDRPPDPPETSEFADLVWAARALEQDGFARPRARPLELPLRAADGDEIFEIFRTGTIRLAGLLASQSAGALAAVREEFVRLLAPWTGAGGVDVPMRAILHSAQRP
jgi:SAM-dependent methyltransferase